MQQVSAKEAPLVGCVSVEIWVHTLVFAVIVVPLVAIALPVVLSSFATYMVFQSLISLWNDVSVVPPVKIEFGTLVFSFTLLLLARFLGGYRESISVDKEAQAELAARLRQPKGAAGQVLCDTINRIWRLTPSQAKPTPNVSWYSGFQVAAHARLIDQADFICVSSALWDRVNKKDLTAELILAHEMGHVLHRDWRTFRLLSLVLHGIRSVLRFSKILAIFAAFIVLFLTGVGAAIHGEVMWKIARLECATIAIAALCLFLLTFSDLFLRRYVSFIVAMMEIRADLNAALWTIGLEGFAKQLESDLTLHRSTGADLRRSFFSPDMTHISESERIALIRMPDRLFTPKLRYFAWSIILAFVLPLNPITPLLVNGAIDHLVIVSMAASLYAVAMAMLVLASFGQAISWKRCAILAAAVCFALGLTSINLYEVGYLLTHYSVAIANDSGFGQSPISWSDLGNDIVLVTHGLAEKAANSFQGWWILASMLIVMVAMKLVRSTVRSSRTQVPHLLCAYVAAATTFFVAIAAGRDLQRSDLYDYFSALIPGVFENLWFSIAPIHHALPAIAGLISVVVLRLILE